MRLGRSAPEADEIGKHLTVPYYRSDDGHSAFLPVQPFRVQPPDFFHVHDERVLPLNRRRHVKRIPYRIARRSRIFACHRGQPK